MSALAPCRGREADFDALFAQALAYAVTAGGNAIHVMAGRVPEQDRGAAADVFVANLSRAAPKAAEHGLTLLLEALNPHDMPGYFYSRIDEAADIIDRVGAPNLRLMFDVYHVGRVGDDVFALLDRHLDRIGHVQIAAVPSRAEPDEGNARLPRRVREARRDRLCRLGRLRIPTAADDRRRPQLDEDARRCALTRDHADCATPAGDAMPP